MSNRYLKSTNNSPSIIQVYDEKRFCSTRAATATFIIVILIIIAAGVSVGVALAVIKSSSSSGSGSGNTTQNSYSTPSASSLTTILINGSQVGPPCTSYTQINDPTRSINNIISQSTCDTQYPFNTTNGGSWIRFVGSGGTIIPLTSPGMNHCGGFLSGWYNDTLPIVTNVITNGTICFETNADVCGLIIDTLVVYCPSNFYIYFLSPIHVCNARYCTV